MKKMIEAVWGKPKEATFDYDRIEYFYRKRKAVGVLQSISDQTASDIDLKNVFSFVDRTHSKIGQQYLFSKLCTIERDLEFTEQENLCERLTNNSKVRLQVQAQLSKLNDDNAYDVVRLFLDDFINPPKYFSIIKTLSLLSIASFIGTFFLVNFLF